MSLNININGNEENIDKKSRNGKGGSKKYRDILTSSTGNGTYVLTAVKNYSTYRISAVRSDKRST